MKTSRFTLPRLIPLHLSALLSLLLIGCASTASTSMPDATRVTSTENLLPGITDAAWQPWSPPSLTQFHAKRVTLPARSPKGTVDHALSLKIDRDEAYARWVARIPGITPDATYEFSIDQKLDGTDFPGIHVPLVLSWLADGKRVPIQRNYIDQPPGASGSGWQQITQIVKAPAGVQSLSVELGLCWKGGASVLWKNPQLHVVAPLPPRIVRIATTHIVPPHSATVEGNTKLMADMLDRIGPEKPDVVVFSENLVDRGVPKLIDETAQTIPGPLTQMLSEKARRYRTYITTSLNEVDAKGHLFTTAVLIDRTGAIVGTYRKVHIPLDEAEKGSLPGRDYPVFDTDFGRVGLQICWDNWFPETSRIMRLNGAEIILMPIAGDDFDHWSITSKARAIDNRFYLVSAITRAATPSQIINPMGQVVGEATGTNGYVIAEIDLNEQWRVWYRPMGVRQGEYYLKERRPDTYQRLLKE